MTSGLSGSPAPTTSRSAAGLAPRSSRISIRHTVGGAQSVFTWCAESTSSERLALKRAASCTSTVAPAFHGAKKLLHACLAHPGELMFWWTSPSLIPIQYIVERWPTG